MVDATQLILFVAASLVLTIAPGPDLLYVIACSLAQGPKAGVVAAFGLSTGVVVHTSLAATGIFAALRASPWAFGTIRLAGAGYLFYLAWEAFRAKTTLIDENSAARQPLRQIFGRSVAANALNPKVAIFFLALLPQFTLPQRGHVALQLILLGGVFLFLSAAVFCSVACVVGSLGNWLRRNPRAGTRLNWAAGATFTIIGLKLAIG